MVVMAVGWGGALSYRLFSSLHEIECWGGKRCVTPNNRKLILTPARPYREVQLHRGATTRIPSTGR